MKSFKRWEFVVISLVMALILGSPPAGAVQPWDEQAILPYFQSIADVAVDGNLAASSSSDAVNIYRRGSDGAWTPEQTISTSQIRSVAVSSDPVLGEFVIFGSVQEMFRFPQILGGSVYVYASDGAGGWSLQNTLRPTGLEAGDLFGYRLAFDGQTLAVSAPADDDQGTDAGAVYMFDGSSSWSLQDKVLPPSGRGDIFYGWAVDVSGDRLVVGAMGDDTVAADAGTAFVYGRQSDQSWLQLTELVGTGLAANFLFGTSVAIDANTVVVGTPGTGSIGASPYSAYIFVENSGWPQQTILQPPPTAGSPFFGNAVDISGDMVAVGAKGGNSLGFSSGSVWVFSRSGTSWSLEDEITVSDGAAYAFYGGSVAIDDSTIIAAAPGIGGGSSYVHVGSDYVYQAPPTPPRTEVSVRAIEVNQAVQNWNNSVTIIEGKTTVVRAFVELLPGEGVPRTISARLYGWRGSQAIPGGPLSPVNSTVTVEADIVLRRAVLDDSLNFLLPKDWTWGNVDVDLKLVLIDEAGEEILTECNEPGGSSSDCTVSVRFNPSESLSVRLFGVPWIDKNEDNHVPSRGQLLRQLSRIEASLPIDNVDVSFGYYTQAYTSKPDLSSTVNPDLKLYYRIEFASCNFNCWPDIRYYALLVGAGSDASDHNIEKFDSEGNKIQKKATSAGNAARNVASGFAPPSRVGRPYGQGYPRNRAAHEIAHTLGISHTIDPEQPLSDNNYKQGSCGSKSDRDKADFPDHGFIEGGSRRAPVLGPLVPLVPGIERLDADVDAEIWGFDTSYAYSYLQNNASGLAVVDPRVTPALMSYCGGGPQGRWVSQFNYERLIGAIANPPRNGSSAAGGDGVYLFVSGVMDADGTSVQNKPVIEVSGTPLLPVAGAYRIALNDASGTELTSVAFEPVKSDTDAVAPGDSTERQQSLLFTVPIPKPAVPIAEIIVSNNSVEISRVVASSNPPSVVITQPIAGQNLDTDLVTLEWQGSDVDGDALTYTVLYSPDGGSSWTPLAINTSTESYELERIYMSASSDARIQVAVSDGVNTSVSTSDAFSVANSEPLVLIKQPGSGLSFANGKTVILETFAYDIEDSSIDDSAITWASDIDSALGSGRELMTSTLATGLHTITVTVTDSAGAASTDSIILGIGVPLPDITVTDTISPTNDQQIGFTDLTIGGSSDQTVTLSNDGNAGLVLGVITQNNALAAPFSLVNDTCSGQTVVAAANCTFDVRFAPTATGVFSDSFDIPSNDPDESSVTVSVSGAGLAVVNITPSSPALVSPTDGQQGLATSVTLKWQPATDSDGDTLSYDVYNCTDSDPVNNCTRQAQVTSLNKDRGNGAELLANLGMGGGIMILGVTLIGGTRSRRQTVLLVVTIVLSSLLVSCSSGGGGSNDGGNNINTKTYTVSALNAGTTYYWAVVANDGNGGETSSAVWSYRTQ